MAAIHKVLSPSQIENFWRDGFLTVEDAVNAQELAGLRQQLDEWIHQSRQHSAPYGPETIDGRARFDMGKEHSAMNPALRRVNNPSDISSEFFSVMSDSAMVDSVSDLIGPNVKFHHCKVNLKLPGSNTEVGYHQDFGYTPHTNDDVVTALLMLDDMTPANGCLNVVPGSHTGPMHSLFDDTGFTGIIADSVTKKLQPKEVAIYGTAGSACLMHTRLVHGSAANRSQNSRALYICVYSAADAFPLARNPMENPNEGRILRGQSTRSARLTASHIELPEQPKSASFFTVIGQASKNER